MGIYTTVSKMPLTLQLSPKKTKKNFTLAGLLSDKDHCLSNYIFDVNFTSKRDKATTIVNQNRVCDLLSFSPITAIHYQTQHVHVHPEGSTLQQIEPPFRLPPFGCHGN